MGILNLSITHPDYYYTTSVISTECANIYVYNIFADAADSIDITLVGSHINEYYTLNGVQTSFTDTVTVAFDTTLTIHFVIENSGSGGVFDEVDVEFDNTTAVSVLVDTVSRDNDNPKCNVDSDRVKW